MALSNVLQHEGKRKSDYVRRVQIDSRGFAEPASSDDVETLPLGSGAALLNLDGSHESDMVQIPGSDGPAAPPAAAAPAVAESQPAERDDRAFAGAIAAGILGAFVGAGLGACVANCADVDPRGGAIAGVVAGIVIGIAVGVTTGDGWLGPLWLLRGVSIGSTKELKVSVWQVLGLLLVVPLCTFGVVLARSALERDDPSS